MSQRAGQGLGRKGRLGHVPDRGQLVHPRDGTTRVLQEARRRDGAGAWSVILNCGISAEQQATYCGRITVQGPLTRVGPRGGPTSSTVTSAHTPLPQVLSPGPREVQAMQGSIVPGQEGEHGPVARSCVPGLPCSTFLSEFCR